MKKLLLGLLLAIGLGVGSSTAQAVIIQTDFAGAAGNEASFTLTSNNPDVVPDGTITRIGLTPNSAADAYSASGFTLSSSVDLSKSYSLTLDPLPGKSVTLTEFSFAERRSGTGPTKWELRGSHDGFASVLGSGMMPDNTVTRNYAIPLSGLAEFTDSYEFRLYGFGAESTLGTWRVDDIIIKLNAVPEPQEYGMIAAAGLMFFAVYRKVRQRRGETCPPL